MDGVDDLKVTEVKIINLSVDGSFFEQVIEPMDDEVAKVLSGLSLEFRGQDAVGMNRVAIHFKKKLGEKGFSADLMVTYTHHIDTEES